MGRSVGGLLAARRRAGFAHRRLFARRARLARTQNRYARATARFGGASAVELESTNRERAHHVRRALAITTVRSAAGIVVAELKLTGHRGLDGEAARSLELTLERNGANRKL